MKDSELIDWVMSNFENLMHPDRVNEDVAHRAKTAVVLLDNFRCELIAQEEKVLPIHDLTLDGWPKQMPVDVIKSAMNHLSKEDKEGLFNYAMSIHNLEKQPNDYKGRCETIEKEIEKVMNE